ncbi:MAG: hypothetical protein ABIH26_05390 [Candidatus Eisenbacteria bacterium]
MDFLRKSGRAWPALAAVLLLAALASLWKIHLFEASPRYDPRTDRLLFWTESAFHYRYAKMVAEGKPIPEIDYAAQMPEGLRPFSHITIGMELVSGALFRALRAAGLVDAPFHVFLIRFICWFSSLSILGAYLAGRAVWRGAWTGAAAAALYAVSPLGYYRLVGNYGREDFTLPLLFFFVAFFFRTLGEERRGRRLIEANIAGFFAAASLATWHLSRFFLLAFAPAIVVLVLLANERKRLRDAVWTATAWQLAASFTVPVLVEKRHALSGEMFLFYAASILLHVSVRRVWRPARTAVILAGAFVLLYAGGTALRRNTEYSHVSGLVVQKLVHLGSKPEDPRALPFEARVFWAPPFNSPGPAIVIGLAGVVGLWFSAGLVGGLLGAARRRMRAEGASIVYLSFAFLLFFLLVERLVVILVFFLAVLSAGIPVLAKRGRAGLAALLLLVIAWQAVENARGPSSAAARLARAVSSPREEPRAPNYGNNRRLVEWIRTSTDPDDVFLTWYPTGPMVLVDGGRPIVLHSKFESSVIRARYRGLLEALYGSEEEMAALCERLGIDYFLFQANFVVDATDYSETYGAGYRAVPARSAAFLFHFYPEELQRFTLVYQDSYYRVYRFGAPLAPLPHRLPREEVWEAVRPSLDEPALDSDAVPRILAAVEERRTLFESAHAAFAAEDRAAAGALVRRLLELSPDAEEAVLLGARIEWLEDRKEEALRMIEHGLETRPESAELWFLKGRILLDQKRPVRAGKAFAAALRSNPGHPDAKKLLETIDRSIHIDPG